MVSAARKKGVHVLVIDDDPITLEVVRDRLERAGYDVSAREDAFGATRWIAEHSPDLVLLDVMMPDLSGPELASQLQTSAAGTSVGIVLHSSKPTAELFELVRSTGVVGAIRKTNDEQRFIAEFDHLARTTTTKSTAVQ